MHTRHISVWLAVLFAVAGFLSPLQAQVCTVRGTVYQVDGVTPATGVEISVTRAEKTGYLYVNTTRTTKTNVLGKFVFTVPRTVGTDTAWIHLKSNVGELASGQILYVPDADSAVLGTWTSPTKPYFVPVLIAGGGGTGDSVSLNNHPRILRIERDLGQFTSSTSDSLQQAQADAKLALNISQGKAGADSVHTVLVALSDLIAGNGNADSIHTQLITLYNLVAGKPNADSVHTAIDAMLKKADTTALHAQRFALINDSLAAISLRATTTKNDLTTHIGTADAHLPSQTTHSGKFLQTNGTVTSWQPEADPTASSRIDSALSQGARSIGTAGRYTVGLDSLTLTALADTIDVSLGNKWIVSLTRNDTLYFKNWPAFPVTADLEITVVQTGTYTLVFSGVRWSGSAPTITATANKIDSFAIINRKGYILGFPGVQGM